MRVLDTLRNGWFISVLAAFIGGWVLVSSWPEGGAPSASAQWRPGGTPVSGRWVPVVARAPQESTVAPASFIELGGGDRSEGSTSDLANEWENRPGSDRPKPLVDNFRNHGNKVDPKPKPPSIGMYTVQKGDRYWTIAERLLGNAGRHKELLELNPTVPAKKLRPGMKIRVPVNSGSTVKTAAARDIKKLSPPQSPPQLRFHRVRAGESLSEIASRFYTDGNWRRIYSANSKKIKNPNRVEKGTMLLIPWAPGKEKPS